MKTLDDFQKNNTTRVLLLNLKDERAAGANLTMANHCIFLHPMLAASRQDYVSCETQAIGRIKRYGQMRTVNIWRLIAKVRRKTTCHLLGLHVISSPHLMSDSLRLNL